MSNLAEVYSEWQNNSEFRTAFKKDAKAALKQWGFELNDNDLNNILKLKKDNDQLDERVNK